MAGHKYAEVLRWIADGEKVQIKMEEWVTCSAEGAMRHILNEYHHQFRLKPRMLKIAGKEIASPLIDARYKQTVYASDATGRVAAITFNAVDITHGKGHEDALANGRLFATPEAAKAAYDAITALLTGKDAA